jgi:hypothetical protein
MAGLCCGIRFFFISFCQEGVINNDLKIPMDLEIETESVENKNKAIV